MRVSESRASFSRENLNWSHPFHSAMEWGDCVQNIVQKLERQGGARKGGSTQAMGRLCWKETVNDFGSLIPFKLPTSLNKHWALCSITMSEAYLDYVATPLSFLMAFWFSKDAYFDHSMYPDSHSPPLYFLFLIGSHSTVPADLELVILMPRPECWDYRHARPLSAHTTILNRSTTEYFWVFRKKKKPQYFGGQKTDWKS